MLGKLNCDSTELSSECNVPLGFQERTTRCLARERDIPVFGDLGRANRSENRLLYPDYSLWRASKDRNSFPSRQGRYTARRSRPGAPGSLRNLEIPKDPFHAVESIIPRHMCTCTCRCILRRRSYEPRSRTILGIELITLRAPATSPN